MVGEVVKKENKEELWVRVNGNEDLKDGLFGVVIVNGGRDGRKLFDGIFEVFILDDFLVVEWYVNDEGFDKSSVCGDGMGVGDLLIGNLDRD